MFLQERDAKILRRQKVDLVLEDADIQYQKDAIWACKPRAIIKALAPLKTGVREKPPQETLSLIVRLNNLGIWIRDIHEGNFSGGRVLDFGSSWTAPHKLQNALGGVALSEQLLIDRSMFEQMVRDGEFPNPEGIKAIHSMKRRSQRR